MTLKRIKSSLDIQQNDIQHHDIKQNDTQHRDIKPELH